MLAHRTTLFAQSGTARARAAAKAAAAGGRRVIDLSAGEIWCEPPGTVLAGAMAAIERGENRYTDTVGIPLLRESIAQRVSCDTGQVWSADEVAVTAGAKQALFNAAMVVLNPGDEVLIPAPYWTTFPAQVQIAGAKAVFVDTRADGYLPRIDNLRAAITSATRAIVVNTPNNPTGAVYDRTLLEGIAELAMRANLWVIFDECYSSFVHEPKHHESIASIAPEVRSRTLIVNAFSKQLALTGWRLGYLVGPKEVIAAVKTLQSHTTSNPNVIAQYAALAHLESGDRSFEAGLRSMLGAARTRGLEILSGLKDVAQPGARGGFYFYLDLSPIIARCDQDGSRIDIDEIARLLIEKGAVASVSGSAFGDPTGLRLSYGVPLDKLESGLTRLVETLNTLNCCVLHLGAEDLENVDTPSSRTCRHSRSGPRHASAAAHE